MIGKEILITELNRIRNLFEHKRGVVISEQKMLLKEAQDLSCVRMQLPVEETSAWKKYSYKNSFGKTGYQTFENSGAWRYLTPNGGTINGTWSCSGKGFIISVPKGQAAGLNGSDDPKYWPSSQSSYYFDSSKNTHSFNPVGWTEGVYSVKQQSSTATPPKTGAEAQKTTTSQGNKQTIKEIIQSVEDKCNPGTKYNWNSVKIAYQAEKNPSTPIGSSMTNQALYKDWKNGWRPECKKAEPKPEFTTKMTAEVKPTELPQTLQAPDKATAYNQQVQAAKEETGQDIYKKLYDLGLVQGDPEGPGRLRMDTKGLDASSVEKLKQYMPSIGYEYFRTRRKDGRLVFTKIQEPIQ